MTNKDQFNLVFKKLNNLEHRISNIEKEHNIMSKSVDPQPTTKKTLASNMILTYSGVVFFLIGASYLVKMMIH
jgi:hypothetical protein